MIATLASHALSSLADFIVRTWGPGVVAGVAIGLAYAIPRAFGARDQFNGVRSTSSSS